MQKKWKHVRDNFSRELKKQKSLKSGSGASKSNPYIYFQRLMFLESTLRDKPTTSNLESPVEEENDAFEDLQSAPAGTSALSRTTESNKRLKMNAVDKQFIDILNKSVAIREKRASEIPQEDEDKMFCLSLYKELQKVPEHGRIRTKIQMLEVLQRAQEYYNTQHFHPPPQTQATYPSLSINQFDNRTNQRGFGSSSQGAMGTSHQSALSPNDSEISQISIFSDIYN